MTGYLKLEVIVDKEADVEADFETLGLSDGEILSVVSWLHYSVIESVAKNLGLNAEETNNKIRQIIMQSSDALLKHFSNIQKEEKEHGNVIRLDRHI